MANIDNIDDATTVRELEVNDTVYDIVGKGVLDQNNRTTNLEWIGTKAEYEALGAYSDKCTYIITDDSADSQSDEIGAIAEDINTVKGGVNTLNGEVNTLKGYDYVVDWQTPTADNNYTWYRKYKSGWVEQGGYTSGNIGSSDTGSITITLPVAMSDANYTLTTGTGCSNVSGMHGKDYITSKSATSFVFTYSSISGSFRVNKFSWQVSGMSAQ